MLVQGSCVNLAQSDGIPLSFQDVFHLIVRSVLIIKSQIAGEILRDHPVLDVLADHLTVYGFSKDLINLDQTGKILPTSGCGKDLSVYGILHPVEIFSAKLQIGDHRRMNSLLVGVFLPYIKVCLHINLLDTIQSDHIEFPDGFVIFRRVACCDDYPAFRHLLVSEGFSLKELQHHRCQCLGYTVDLINKQDSLSQACFFHLIVNGRNDLTHGIFCDRKFFLTVILFYNKRKSHSTLPGVVGNGIGNKSNPAFPCYLFHNLCLSDSRRAHKKDRSLSDCRDPVLTEFVL